MNTLTKFIIIIALSTASAACSSGSGSRSEDLAGLSEQDLDAQQDSRFGSGSIPQAEGEGVLRDIRFDYDSSAITDQSRQDIEYNVEVLKENPDVKIQLEGHCDERGTADYNLALGATRAKSVRDALASVGIPNSRLNTISYGEEIPLKPGHNEEAWASNRRVHFSAYRDLPGSER